MSDGRLWPLQEPRDGPQFYGLSPPSSFSQNQGQLTSDIVSFLLQPRVPWKDSKATYLLTLHSCPLQRSPAELD